MKVKCRLKQCKSYDIIKNTCDEIDRLAEIYIRTKTTDALIDYIEFRYECIEMDMKLSWMNIYPHYPDHKLYNCMVYISIITDELKIFDGSSVPDGEYIDKIKKWRSEL